MGPEFEVIPCSSKYPYHVADENLPTLGESAQPSGLDDGPAEAVAFLPNDVAGTHAHADERRRLSSTVQPIDALLYGDRPRQGIRSAVEGHHGPVAEALDDSAAARTDRITHDLIEVAAKRFGSLISECRSKIGGAHQITEEHRDDVGHRSRMRAARIPPL